MQAALYGRARAHARRARRFELELVVETPGMEMYDDDWGRGAMGAAGPQV